MRTRLTLENVVVESNFPRAVNQQEPDRQWGDVIDELLAARSLQEDWDGQGAKAPSVDAVDTSLSLAQKLKQLGFPPPNDFGPGVNGTITLAWRLDTSSIEFEVFAPTRIEGYRWRKGDERAERIAV